MTAPMSEEMLAEIEARHKEQTPGPYRWEGIVSGHCLRLMAHTQPWRPIVMDFVRWGMNRAQPRFRDETHSIGIMAPAKDFVVPVAEHRPWEVGYIDHPDAIGLAASWQDKDDLLAEVRRLQSEVAAQHLFVAGAQDAWQALDAIMVDHGMDHKAQPAAAQQWLRERLDELAAAKDRRCETCGRGLGWMRYPGNLAGGGWCRWLFFNSLATFSCSLWSARQTTKDGDAP